ncbi:MAG: Rrf2 family transcriptional regulator [Planctomycetes bacterium]|nr:Rrf2 family transcriptional regulator [Planctomycetota bacterium]
MPVRTVIRRDTDHALRMLVHIASQGGQTTSAPVIARKLDIPAGFAHKILRKLSKAGILRSKTGNSGGFRLAGPMLQISLFDIISAVQPPPLFNICTGGEDGCVRRPSCRISAHLRGFQDRLNTFLRDTRLSDILDDPADGASRAMGTNDGPIARKAPAQDGRSRK